MQVSPSVPTEGLVEEIEDEPRFRLPWKKCLDRVRSRSAQGSGRFDPLAIAGDAQADVL
jgi:hypothetical protein